MRLSRILFSEFNGKLNFCYKLYGTEKGSGIPVYDAYIRNTNNKVYTEKDVFAEASTNITIASVQSVCISCVHVHVCYRSRSNAEQNRVQFQHLLTRFRVLSLAVI